MPPVIAAAAIAAGATIYGTRQQSNAHRDASRMEQDSFRRAEDAAREDRDYNRRRDEERQGYDRRFAEDERSYRRGQFADYQGRLAPFRDVGVNALPRLSRAANTGLSGAQMGMAGGGGQMVRIQAPLERGGGIREVPAALADRFLAAGGKVVQ
jgi:Ni/Co efflux regulator RcnB